MQRTPRSSRNAPRPTRTGRRNRTFTGCWKCRSRKVKECDETKPQCRACQRLGVTCSGYDARFLWVHDDSLAVKSDGRRILACEATWSGFTPLESELVDLLIFQCDVSPEPDSNHRDGHQGSLLWGPEYHNPFSVFRGFSGVTEAVDLQSPGADSPSSEETALSLLPRNLDVFPDMHGTERFLFHHYVNYVSAIMLPYEHPRNAWKSCYPAAAIELSSTNDGALYSALLSHSAFNIAHLLGGSTVMSEVGSRYYANSIRQLIPNFGDISSRNFSATIASIFCLMFAEVYRGHSSDWKHHLRGAWTLLSSSAEVEPWMSGDLACISIQSLNIIRIVAETTDWKHKATFATEDPKLDTPGTNTNTRGLISSVLDLPEFGFTIGAPGKLLGIIARITEWRRDTETGSLETDVSDVMEDILSRLNVIRAGAHANPSSDRSSEVTLQAKAFLAATYIYLYRTLLDVPPKSVRKYAVETLECVSAFFSNSSGNFSIWPAFIAAAEAYTEEDMAAVRSWLGCATAFGIGSRAAVKRVLEEVWARREHVSKISGMDPEMVIIDWRAVMHELDCNILLV